MRVFHWLVTAPLAVILIVFAVNNRDAVTLSFWPLPLTLQAPLYLIALVMLLVGFLIGELVAWVNGRRWRREARHSARRVAELERAMAAQAEAKERAKELTRT
ncbi:MAG TPA: LapA family protein [Stellaceae bacterium]|nr:LapA family protein [Stellaceae bacterium]